MQGEEEHVTLIVYRAEFLNSTKNRTSGHVQNPQCDDDMYIECPSIKPMSFEHATDRFYTLIHVFSVYS